MNKLQIITMSTVAAGLVGISGVGVAQAATMTTASSSAIPQSVLKTERQSATATVLNTSTDTIQAAHKNHTFKDLLSKAGLTRKTFAEKMKAQVASDLKAKGYSDAQITATRQQHRVHHLRHELKKARAKN